MITLPWFVVIDSRDVVIAQELSDGVASVADPMGLGQIYNITAGMVSFLALAKANPMDLISIDTERRTPFLLMEWTRTPPTITVWF